MRFTEIENWIDKLSYLKVAVIWFAGFYNR